MLALIAKLCALTLSKDIWSGPAVRILYLQSGPVRKIYTTPLDPLYLGDQFTWFRHEQVGQHLCGHHVLLALDKAP